MIKYENRCVDCSVPAYPCRGNCCPYLNVEVHYCDKCGEELEEIYEVDSTEYCEDCLLDTFRKE